MFRILSIILACVALYFAVIAVLDLRHYSRLTGTTIAKEPRFEVENLNEKYFLKTHYQIGPHLIDSTYQPHFLNEWAAEQDGKRWVQNPRVWVDAEDLSYSSLQKTFPIKQLAYTLVLMLLGGYFFILDRRVSHGSSTFKRRSKSDI